MRAPSLVVMWVMELWSLARVPADRAGAGLAKGRKAGCRLSAQRFSTRSRGRFAVSTLAAAGHGKASLKFLQLTRRSFRGESEFSRLPPAGEQGMINTDQLVGGWVSCQLLYRDHRLCREFSRDFPVGQLALDRIGEEVAILNVDKQSPVVPDGFPVTRYIRQHLRNTCRRRFQYRIGMAFEPAGRDEHRSVVEPLPDVAAV